MAISNSVELLLGGAFDYAGMYPPANLSFEEAFEEAVQLPRMLKNSWLIGNNFVGDLEALRKVSGLLVPMRFCLLSSTRDTEELARVITALNDVKVTTYEFKSDRPVLNQAVSELIPGLEVQFAEPINAELNLVSFVEACASNGLGVKLRCGGERSYPFDAIVKGVTLALKHQVPLKFTAGLHHPLVDARYGNSMGFLGLILASAFRYKYQEQFEEPLIAECFKLASISPLSIGQEIGWKGFKLSTQEIADFRLHQRVQIGSCSLTEPDEDLESLFTND